MLADLPVVEFLKLLGPMGFVFWLFHRHTTHTIPRLAADNHEALQQQREDFRAALAIQGEMFKDQLQREREIHEQSADRIVKALEKMSER